jgi:hypothetical protein
MLSDMAATIQDQPSSIVKTTLAQFSLDLDMD